MGENAMHTIVYSSSTYEIFWGEKKHARGEI